MLLTLDLYGMSEFHIVASSNVKVIVFWRQNYLESSCMTSGKVFSKSPYLKKQR